MKITNTQSWRAGARALLGGLVACLVCSLSFAARQESPRSAPSQPGAPHEGPREGPRERWARMSPQEREQMLQRFEKFKQMDDAQRREVIERWQQVQRLERGTREAMHGELSKLGPEQQRECVRGYVGRELFERGRAMREMLPRDLLEKIERAAPEEAQRLLDEFRRMRPELADRALFELGRDLDLDPAEVERLRSLPEEQKRAEMFVLRRRQIEQRFTREGLPSWLTQQEWDELRALDGPQFWERWFARMRQLGFSSPDQHHGDRGGKHGGERGEHRGGGRGEGDPRGAREGEAQGPRLSPERVREVLEQLRPDPKWFNELWKLSPEERCAARAAIETRLRERLLEVLAASPDLATPQEVETLRALQGREFFEAVYQRMRALGIGLPPPREKRPPGEGFGPPPGGAQQPPRPSHEHPPQQHPSQ